MRRPLHRRPVRQDPSSPHVSHVPVLLLVLTLLSGLVVPGLGAQAGGGVELAGDWAGTLTVPGAALRIVFHVEAKGDGWQATMDSPDQGAFGIPVTAVEVARDSVRLRLAALNGGFAGVLSGDTLAGSWSQGGARLPLVLVRGGEALARPTRPQDPEPPFPYDVEEVRFENGEAGIELAGTLTLPRAEGPVPAALLISGSGPQDRDETLMGHRPFRVLADHLTRRGIAVLRVDDRGVGASGGDFATATSLDFVTDAAAGVRYLRGRPEVDAGSVGLVGHSEGGLIAPLTANRGDGVAWVVLLAGPALPGDSIMILQAALIGRAGGQSEEAVRRNAGQQRALFRIIRELAEAGEGESGESGEPSRATLARAEAAAQAVLREGIAQLSPAERAAAGLTDGAAADSLVARTTRQLLSPWFRYFTTHDPRPALRSLEVPALALFGALDLQVPPEQNAGAMRTALEAAPTERWDVRVLPELNHLFQHATTGAPGEYGSIEETFAPEAMEAVAEWVLALPGG